MALVSKAGTHGLPQARIQPGGSRKPEATRREAGGETRRGEAVERSEASSGAKNEKQQQAVGTAYSPAIVPGFALGQRSDAPPKSPCFSKGTHAQSLQSPGPAGRPGPGLPRGSQGGPPRVRPPPFTLVPCGSSRASAPKSGVVLPAPPPKNVNKRMYHTT